MKITNLSKLTLIAVFVLGMLGLQGCHIIKTVTFWPIEPTGSVHPIGNSAGEFQQYGDPPYFHRGDDIMGAPAPGGPNIIAVRPGVPAVSLCGPACLYNGVTMAIADGSNYVYWHLNQASIPQAVRDADNANTPIAAGAVLGRLVVWPGGYHHLHYQIATAGGVNEEPQWTLNGALTDTTPPTIDNIFFAVNGTNTTFPTDAFGRPVVNGNVDIIVQAYDRQFGATFSGLTLRVGVFDIQYRIFRLLTVPVLVQTGPLIRFDSIPGNANASILYRNSPPFDSDSNYLGIENYYYVVTNADAAATSFSEAFAWNTAALPDGLYVVEITARDPSFNLTTLSRIVVVDNVPP